jgi:5'-AMP-activated protein kinase catalytic alpha subunit
MKLCERKLISHSQAKKCLMQEVNILRRVNGHANIIQLLEVIETDTALVLVMEFAASGDLLRYVRQHRKLAEDCAQGLFKQLLDGLDHIHKMCVVHRDIKLENLLLDSFGCLKIADFGVATLLKCPEQRLDDHCGTPSYIAPEVLLDHGYQGPPVDMWSAGIVLYAMLVGHAPFKADHLLDLRRNILRGRYHTPAHLSEEAANLLRRLLIVEPSNRATLGEAADHAWLRKVDNPAIGVYGPAGMLGKGATCLEHFEDLLGRMDDFGFPRDHLEESLGQGKLNRATATFYLLAQQKLRRRALDTGATMITAVGSSLSAAAASICTPRGERSDNERP